MQTEKQGIFVTRWLDWITFRRTFVLRTDATPEIIARRLASRSQPPPRTLLPFTASVSVAVTHTITHTGLFEVHTLRSLPWGDHFSSLVAIGRAKPEEDENGAVIRGEIQPTQRGITIYSGVITLMSLWISAAAVSSVISPMTSLFPAVVATTATVVVTAIILALLTADVRHLSSVLEGIR